MTNQSHPYVVRGVSKNNTITYNCPTPEWAVRKHRDLIESKLSDVTIMGPDRQALSLAELEAVSNEAAVPKRNAQASRG
ncbi:hypothetical protein [Methylobacterium sp. J-092]|uniref:hypothetical protein n=1 Tax=Methylobacterium sp. J-092 TaxID=2836667 RepID=UPI001FBB3D5F|nr:hypothetical protein [Methylobacterium sp. J-092]MCJ2009200.1 hypothetical protein [Methylobacterium sp. J-092]